MYDACVLRFVNEGDRFAIGIEVPKVRHDPGDRETADYVEVTITRGQKTERTRHGAWGPAWQRYYRAIAKQQAAGFALELDGIAVAPPPDTRFTTFAELERMVDDDLDNEDYWLVLGDDAGDPRGECIHAGRVLHGASDPGQFMQRKKAGERARHLRDAHVFGALGHDGYRLRATYRNGLIDTLTLQDEPYTTGRSTRELLSTVLANPFARFARELVLQDADLDGVSEALGARSSLRSLVLRRYDRETPRRGAFAAGTTSAGLGRLERAKILDVPVQWVGCELPNLRELTVRSMLPAAELERILAWVTAHGRIEHVDLTTHDPECERISRAWMAEPASWPATLSKFRCDGATNDTR